MLINDEIHVFPAEIGVPGPFRIDDNDRAFLATAQAAGSTGPDPAGIKHTCLLESLPGVTSQFAGAVVLAAGAAIVALIGAEKGVSLIEAHRPRPLRIDS